MRSAPDDHTVTAPSTEGLPLFALPRETRAAAQEKAERKGALHRRLLLEAFKLRGPCTADEAGEKCGLAPLSARPRASELYKAGDIEPVARGESSNGNSATVWRAK